MTVEAEKQIRGPEVESIIIASRDLIDRVESSDLKKDIGIFTFNALSSFAKTLKPPTLDHAINKLPLFVRPMLGDIISESGIEENAPNTRIRNEASTIRRSPAITIQGGIKAFGTYGAV